MLDLTLPLEIVGLVFLLLLCLLAGFTLRRYLLTRTHGSFDCAYRDGSGWVVGIARYQPDRIDWHRIFAFGFAPARSFSRGSLEVLRRREAAPQERAALLPDSVICVCSHEGREFELAMSMDAYMGLSSWTESGPPGRQWTSS